MKSLLITLTILSFTLVNCNPTKEETRISYRASEEFKKANLPFSEAVVVDNVIYLSGQIGSNPQDAMTLVEGGIKEEARQALENMEHVLEANGSSMENVVKCTVMLADIREWGEFNKEYIKFFPGNKPARSAFGTSGLALGARVEIECIAVIN